MESHHPLVPEVKIEIDVAEEPPLSYWTEAYLQGKLRLQGSCVQVQISIEYQPGFDWSTEYY